MKKTATAIAQKCFICNSTILPVTIHMKYGLTYCSISCQDIGEERNQGNDSICFEEFEKVELWL